MASVPLPHRFTLQLVDMASSRATASHFLLFLLAATVICVGSTSVAPGWSRILGGRKTGGRTAISDVRENKEVQDLGCFAVGEHNRRLGPDAGADHRLVYGGVVRAERQVVSGIKYYLRIVAVSDREAAGGSVPGSGHPFDAVVVDRAWLGSKELLSFVPSTTSSNPSRSRF